MIYAGQTETTSFYFRDDGQNPVIADGPPAVQPLVVIIRNNVDTSVVPVVTTRPVDNAYLISAAIPATWVKGDVVDLRISGVVNGKPLVDTVTWGVIQLDEDDVVTAVSSSAAAAATATAVWGAQISAHNTPGSFGHWIQCRLMTVKHLYNSLHIRRGA